MKLQENFYLQDTLKVAHNLLGCILVHKLTENKVCGMIVETEAYMGITDKGAHSFGGRHTPRMDPLYKRGGYAYIYQLHGNNYCLNVVAERNDQPRAVLIRALEPVEGLKSMAERREIDLSKNEVNKGKDKPSFRLRNLTNGPSKLCQAMGIDNTLNGIDLLGDRLYIIPGKSFNNKIVATPRINIEYAEEDKDKPWRFIVKGNNFLSRVYKE